jgi:hypothetical protein
MCRKKFLCTLFIHRSNSWSLLIFADLECITIGVNSKSGIQNTLLILGGVYPPRLHDLSLGGLFENLIFKIILPSVS